MLILNQHWLKKLAQLTLVETSELETNMKCIKC